MVYYNEEQIRKAIDRALGANFVTLSFYKSAIVDKIMDTLSQQTPLTLNVTINVNHAPNATDVAQALIKQFSAGKISL